MIVWREWIRMPRVRRPYRSPLPIVPRNRATYRNQTDFHDTGNNKNAYLERLQLIRSSSIERNIGAIQHFDVQTQVGRDPVKSVIDASTATKKTYLYQRYNEFDPRINYTTIFDAIRSIIMETFTNTVRRGEAWIDLYVPKATGQLRESLKRFLRAPTNLPNAATKMLLRVFSNVRYLKYVANMDPINYTLKHSPPQRRKVYYYGRPREVILDDPQAKHFFYTYLVIYLRRIVREELARAIMRTCNRLNLPQFWFREQIVTVDK